MLFLSESDIRRLLPMRDAIRLTREAFIALKRGEAQNQPRRRLTLPGGAVLHSLAGAYGKYFGTKVYSTHPKHGAWFLFMLYEAETARPLALMEANYLGQIRTGAATGVATDILARPGVRAAAVIGTGFQAHSQLEALLAVRNFEVVKVWSRRAEKREAFAARFSGASSKVTAAETAEEAVRNAEVVVTATYSKDPVLDAAWLAPYALVNAVGSNNPQRRELPPEVIKNADLIILDSREQARLEAGDLVLSLDERGWEHPRLVELADIILQPPKPSGRLTVFKSVGLGLEDVAVAGYAFEKARQSQTGSEVPLFLG